MSLIAIVIHVVQLMYRIGSSSNFTWQSLENSSPYMLKGVQELAYSTIDGTVMYLFGGYNANCTCASTGVYKWNSSIPHSNFSLMSVSAPMKFILGGKSAVTINNRYIYIMGIRNYNANPRDYVWIFDTSSETFDSSSVTLPTGVLHTCAVTNGDNSKIYVLAGQTSNGATDIVQVFDVNLQSWSNAQNMPVPLQRHGCAYFDDSIYSFGAEVQDETTGVWAQSTYIFHYDVAKDSWQQLTQQLSQTYLQPAAMVLESHNLIIILSNKNGICELFDPSNHQIVGQTSFVHTRLYGAFGYINGYLYATVGRLYPSTAQAKTTEKLFINVTNTTNTTNTTTTDAPADAAAVLTNSNPPNDAPTTAFYLFFVQFLFCFNYF